jgi:serine/threonine protein kinase/tetratricopeptide (TPR) repeat protein
MTQFRELTDRYALEKILKSTRAGTVLKARDGRTGQTVAVKLVTVTSPAVLVQKTPELEKLGAALEALREPSLPAVTDFGFSTDGAAFLVMELLAGKTLDTLAGSPERVLTLLFQALDGLEALARRGLAHHNLAPDNLLVVGAPGAERVKLLGLGSALFQEAAPAETARFRAPELDASPGTGPADWRADLYSFSRVACQLLGIALTPGESPGVQMPFALSLELQSSDALGRILERCLRRNPAERPSHQEIRDAFRLALGQIQAPPAPEPKPAAPKLVIPTASAPQHPAPPSPLRPPAAVAPIPSIPPVSPSEPEPFGSEEMLSAIDDDFLDSLTGPPAAGSGASEPAAGRVVPFPQGARAAAVAVPEPPPANALRRSTALIAVAAVLVLGAALAFWWLSRGAASPEMVAEAPAVPSLPPRRPAIEVIAEAQQAMADEDWAGALATLRTLNAADQAKLTPEGCRTLTVLEETLGRVALERLPQDLAQGLRTGDLGRLRFAVFASGGQDAALSEPLRADLERARGVLDLYAGIEEAAGREAHLDVLDRFALLETALPAVSDPGGLRAKAAAALETEAEELARAGRYEEALARLDPVLRTWKKREEAADRAKVYRRARELAPEQEALLATLPTAERRRKPHEGLEMLEKVEPVPHLAAQLEDIRKRLEDQLGQLDRQPPQIVLRDGYFLDYDRGRVVELSFRVTDDYQVRDVKLMARPEGGKMREMPLDRSNLGYTVEIGPDFHRNGTVELYVVATDFSGHESSFGSREQPKRLQRRQGFESIVR